MGIHSTLSKEKGKGCTRQALFSGHGLPMGSALSKQATYRRVGMGDSVSVRIWGCMKNKIVDLAAEIDQKEKRIKSTVNTGSGV